MNINTKERLRLIAAEEIVKRITNEPDLSKDEAALLEELPFQQRLRVELLRGNKQVLDSFLRWRLIDGGYRGEIMASCDNIKEFEYKISKGDRLFHLVAPDASSIEFESKIAIWPVLIALNSEDDVLKLM